MLPLQEVLKVLEQRYAISFTYADQAVEDILLTPPSADYDLLAALDYMEEHTGLLFQQLNDRFITISKKKQLNITVCGYLKEESTEERIVGATVLSGDALTVTDEEGYFELTDISESDTVAIRYIGYESRSMAVENFNGEQCKPVFLRQHILTLPEIVVNNYITKGISKRVDGSLVINAAQLGILPGLVEPDVLHSIQSMPGIQSINETVSDINVRGGTNDQNLILWDGIKMYQSGHFFGLISAFNPHLIDEVRLIKNGTSAAFGDGASSTINIHTDDKVVQKMVGGGGMNLINGDVYLKLPLSKKASLQLSARRSIADIIETPTYDQYFDRVFRHTDIGNSSSGAGFAGTDENFYFYDFSIKYLYNISEKDKLRVSFLNIYNDIKYQEAAFINNVEEYKTSGLEQHSIASGISYSRLWSDKVKTTGTVNLSSYKLGAVNFDIVNDQRLIQENEVLDISVKLDARVRLANSIDLFSGYQLFEVGVTNFEDLNRPEFRRLIKEVMYTHSAFTEGNFTSRSEKTNLRAGLRVNYFDKLKRYTIEPRIAFHQQLLDHFSVEVLGEFKSQTMAQIIDLQNDFLGVEKRRWVLSNGNDIPLIHSKQLSAGLDYVRKNFLISLEGYYKHVDGITSSSQGFQNQFQYTRAGGNYKTSGIDFLINKKFGKINTWGSYSLAENNFEFHRFMPSIFPNNLDIRHTATIGSSYQSKGFEFSLGVNWRTGKPFTEPVEEGGAVDNTIVYQPPNSSRLESYMRIDVSAKYNFNINKKFRGQIGASVWNFSNRENIVNTYFQLANTDQLRQIDQYSLGVTPNFIFRVSF